MCLPAVIQLPDNDLWCLASTTMAHLAVITLTLSLPRLFPSFQLCYMICALVQHSERWEERPRVHSKTSAYRNITFLPTMRMPMMSYYLLQPLNISSFLVLSLWSWERKCIRFVFVAECPKKCSKNMARQKSEKNLSSISKCIVFVFPCWERVTSFAQSGSPPPRGKMADGPQQPRKKSELYGNRLMVLIRHWPLLVSLGRNICVVKYMINVERFLSL